MRTSTTLLALVLIAGPTPLLEASEARYQSEKPSLSQELEALFKADQADRDYESLSPEQIKAAKARDEERTLRVREIVQKDTLDTVDAYIHAAAVLQHGVIAEDFLTAHVLATIAGYQGSSVGKWLAAATLDRYLQFVGCAQLFGTQGSKEPFSKAIISDTIRKLYCVLPLSEQRPGVSSRLTNCAQ